MEMTTQTVFIEVLQMNFINRSLIWHQRLCHDEFAGDGLFDVYQTVKTTGFDTM